MTKPEERLSDAELIRLGKEMCYIYFEEGTSHKFITALENLIEKLGNELDTYRQYRETNQLAEPNHENTLTANT